MTLQTKHKILLASLAFRVVRLSRKLLGKELQGQFKRNSFQWQLDLREVIDFMIYISGGFETYLSQFIRRNVKVGDVVMDIGANIGAHTLTMGQSVGTSGKAYAVEATEYAFNKLQRNIQLNPDVATHIQPCHCVLEGTEISQDDGALIVGNPHLINAYIQLRHLCGKFRFHPKSIFFNRNLIQHLTTKQFITALHIGQVQVRHHIAQ